LEPLALSRGGSDSPRVHFRPSPDKRAQEVGAHAEPFLGAERAVLVLDGVGALVPDLAPLAEILAPRDPAGAGDRVAPPSVFEHADALQNGVVDGDVLRTRVDDSVGEFDTPGCRFLCGMRCVLRV
jgi:hypothetical protein